MPSKTGFVVIIDFDPRQALGKFAGLDALALVGYLKEIMKLASREIEGYDPDSYERRSEVHRMVWLIHDRSADELLASILALFLDLARELDQMNARYGEKGVPPTTFHAGLSEGNVELGPGGPLGAGVAEACRCAEHARSARAMLAITPKILDRLPAEALQRAGLHSLRGVASGCIPLERAMLVRLSKES